ncbi:Aprataxin-like protein [Sergentomyia squamirostris]
MGHWSLQLLKAMQDPKQIVLKSDLAVAIRDKYPKAKNHFLILSQENIDDIYQLKRHHLLLLEEMELMGKNTVELIGGRLCDFKMGFHAQPSMKRLHLHVVSEDFISPCLKHKMHWNSFTTDFFIPCEKVRKRLQDFGSIEKPSEFEMKELLKKELQCHKCSVRPRNIPQLKEHILKHQNI